MFTVKHMREQTGSEINCTGDTKFDVSLWWNNLLKSCPNFDHPLFVLHFLYSSVSSCKYEFVFCKVESIFAAEIDILVDGGSKETSWPATGDGTFCGLREAQK